MSGSPFRKWPMFSEKIDQTRSVVRREVGEVWGVMTILGADQSGSPAGSGSVAVTSRPAPASLPDSRARISEGSSTMPPRDSASPV
jgi:hypothetical protein